MLVFRSRSSTLSFFHRKRPDIPAIVLVVSFHAVLQVFSSNSRQKWSVVLNHAKNIDSPPPSQPACVFPIRIFSHSWWLSLLFSCVHRLLLSDELLAISSHFFGSFPRRFDLISYWNWTRAHAGSHPSLPPFPLPPYLPLPIILLPHFCRSYRRSFSLPCCSFRFFSPLYLSRSPSLVRTIIWSWPALTLSSSIHCNFSMVRADEIA